MVPGINEVACSLIQEVSRLLETEEGLPETRGGEEGLPETREREEGLPETEEGLPETRDWRGKGYKERREDKKRLLERGEERGGNGLVETGGGGLGGLKRREEGF